MTTAPIRLDARSLAGLRWLRERCRAWQFELKRRRKYAVPRGAGFGPEEAEILKALGDLERATGTLIDVGGGIPYVSTR